MRKLLLFFLAAPLLAQSSERVDVKVINVDVSVIDSAGKAVTGLTRDDFEVLGTTRRRRSPTSQS